MRKKSQLPFIFHDGKKMNCGMKTQNSEKKVKDRIVIKIP